MKWIYATIDEYTPDELNAVKELLSPSRKERIFRLRQEKDRLRSLAAECLLRQLLQEMGGENYAIECTQLGQPVTDCGLFVSIAHSGNHIVCAASEKPIGIDLEEIRPMDLAITRHVCTEEENRYIFGRDPLPEDLKRCGDPETLARFFEIWTGKEAYFKQQGTGIRDLKGISILPLPRLVIQKNGCIITVYE